MGTTCIKWLAVLFLLNMALTGSGKSPEVAYDIEKAREICRQLPLDNVEGVWLYPDDNVTVLILNDQNDTGNIRFPSYSISVVETSDARLHPGEVIGKLESTADESVYKIELSTEKKNDFLLKPKSCLASLSKNGDSFIIKKQKSPFKGRINFNFNRLLPGFWKIVSLGVSQQNSRESLTPPVGMIKIYPSYDGNGSSRRKVRYL